MLTKLSLSKNPVTKKFLLQSLNHPEMPYTYNHRDMSYVFVNLRTFYHFLNYRLKKKGVFEEYLHDLIRCELTVEQGKGVYTINAGDTATGRTEAIHYSVLSEFDDCYAFMFPFKDRTR
ncbi:MAG: hypothetical protein LKI94_08940 [Sporolactobacillus sp.]|jgi:hypothetical protein|nr:hypothetical protein [Sporolactobacillus sp.]